MGFAPVMSAMSAMEEEAKNTKTVYPYAGFDRHFIEKQMMDGRDTSGLVDEGTYERQVTKYVDPEPFSAGKGAGFFNKNSYADTVNDYYGEKLKEKLVGEWTPETTNEDGVRINWKGEELPSRASGWGLDNETPYYGVGANAILNKVLDQFELMRLIPRTHGENP